MFVEKCCVQPVFSVKNVLFVPWHIVNGKGFPRKTVSNFKPVAPHPYTSIRSDFLGGGHPEKIIDVTGGVDALQGLALVSELPVKG